MSTRLYPSSRAKDFQKGKTMRHYDEYGNPTHEHEVLCLKSLELAVKVVKGNYISKVVVQYGEGHKGADFIVSFWGKKAKKKGQTIVKVWPIDHMDKKNEELVDYAIDEIELELVRQHLGWDRCTITNTNLEKFEDMMVLTFSVANK